MQCYSVAVCTLCSVAVLYCCSVQCSVALCTLCTLSSVPNVQCYSVAVLQVGDKERETWVGLVLLSCLLAETLNWGGKDNGRDDDSYANQSWVDLWSQSKCCESCCKGIRLYFRISNFILDPQVGVEKISFFSHFMQFRYFHIPRLIFLLKHVSLKNEYKWSLQNRCSTDAAMPN